MTTKVKKSHLRIAELERKLREAEAMQAHVYHFSSAELDKAGGDRMMGSAVIITITALGGKEIVKPTAIRNGLSADTIAALKADMVASYEDAVAFKPKGVVR